jgi:urocanate hydratase
MPEQLVEGIDYYIESGFVVFTAHYLRNRGYCCESGCRHCPYGFVHKEPADVNSDAD